MKKQKKKGKRTLISIYKTRVVAHKQVIHDFSINKIFKNNNLNTSNQNKIKSQNNYFIY